MSGDNKQVLPYVRRQQASVTVCKARVVASQLFYHVCHLLQERTGTDVACQRHWHQTKYNTGTSGYCHKLGTRGKIDSPHSGENFLPTQPADSRPIAVAHWLCFGS